MKKPTLSKKATGLMEAVLEAYKVYERSVNRGDSPTMRDKYLKAFNERQKELGNYILALEHPPKKHAAPFPGEPGDMLYHT